MATRKKRQVPAETIVMPKVDPGIRAKYAADTEAADSRLHEELAAAGSFDERCAVRRAHRESYERAAAEFDADWRLAWDAACEALYGPVRDLDAVSP
jgi:hypothetical protein